MRTQAATACLAVACALATDAAPAAYYADIQRSAQGIPHITAADWPSLGYGYGYAQAQDNLCTLAQSFVTYQGSRSRYFGASARQAFHSTLEDVSNIDSDFFFKLVADDAAIQTYRDQVSQELGALVTGYVGGYNAYLEQLRQGAHPAAQAACRSQPWVQPITTADLYRRLYIAGFAGGYAQFISAIANAQPPAAAAGASIGTDRLASARIAQAGHPGFGLAQGDEPGAVGGKPGIGSNGIAFGADALAEGQVGLLFGNPHWYWAGFDRFYAARLTIPGQLDVAGASFLGVPVIMLGFNDAVAWTHTVSTARRFGVFELSLDPASPTSYRRDGKTMAMQAVALNVQVLGQDGEVTTQSRTLYRSPAGVLVNLSRYSPALAWTRDKAFVLRDINADNYRVFDNFLAWDRARSLDEFIGLQHDYAAMPWVNTLAVGRGDGRAWYADMGAIPNVSNALAARCATGLSAAFDKVVPGVPFLDGSRAECDWRTDAESRQAGAMPPAAMPGLLRRDYVANMNNTYQYAHPATPIGGYPAIFGARDEPLTLRARLGYESVQRLLRGHPGAPVTPAALAASVLSAEAYSATLFKQQVLELLCARGFIDVTPDPATAADHTSTRRVATAQACALLRAWDGRALADARGAWLWGRIWNAIERIPVHERYTAAFDAAHPLDTPTGLNAANPALLNAIGAGVLAAQAAPQGMDAKWGDVLFVERGGKRLALFGGCDGAGYFTATCAPWHKNAAVDIHDSDIVGNSYMQIVEFGAGSVQASMMLAHGETDDPASPWFQALTERYLARQWTPWAFTPSVSALPPPRPR